MMTLKVYLAGSGARTRETVLNIRSRIEAAYHGEYVLEEIDVMQAPERAEMDGIIATPTLVRVFPEPVRKIIGHLRPETRLAGILFDATAAK
jgi:circadian clock protein KaiB